MKKLKFREVRSGSLSGDFKNCLLTPGPQMSPRNCLGAQAPKWQLPHQWGKGQGIHSMWPVVYPCELLAGKKLVLAFVWLGLGLGGDCAEVPDPAGDFPRVG